MLKLNVNPHNLPHLALIWLLLLSGCSHIPSAEQRYQQANTTAAGANWQAQQLRTNRFNLTSYSAANPAAQRVLTIYLEGDGFAWRSRTQPSLDPTPISPLALQLALTHTETNAAYLARPCQYQGRQDSNCTQRYWTNARFAPEVVEASDQAIEQLKAQHGAQKLILVGYSGGGTLAALLAAKRSDIQLLVTIAAPLDHQAWTTQLRLSPLRESLNPADFLPALAHVPQWHLNGSEDAVVPPSIAHDFVARLSQPKQAETLTLEGFNHHCCWQQHWPQLWTKITPR